MLVTLPCVSSGDEDNEQIHYFELKTGEPQVVMGEYFQLQKVGDEVLG